MNEYELKNLLSIEQDPEHPRAFVSKALADFRPNVKCRVPSAAEALFAEVMGQSLQGFEADVHKANVALHTLATAEVLSAATDLPVLEKAAGVYGTTIQQEIVNVLRKATTPTPSTFPTAVGHIPSTRPQTTPSARSPKSTARRKKLREMFVASGMEITAYSDQAVEALLTAMEQYLDDVVV